MIRIDDIGLSFGGKALLQGISLDLVPGRVYALLGPNGAGKSSLLRVLSGEWKPDSGTVLVESRPLTRWNSRDLARRRAVLPQTSHLVFDYSVEEVVALGRTPHSGGRSEDVLGEQAVRGALARLDLERLRRRPYTTLSGGEKQRVQLARVLAQIWHPPLDGSRYLLLDEPTAGLDLSHRHTLLRQAAELAAAQTAVVVSLHDLNLAFSYADEVIVLAGGSVAAAGATAATLSAELIERTFCVTAEVVSSADTGATFLHIGPAGPAGLRRGRE